MNRSSKRSYRSRIRRKRRNRTIVILLVCSVLSGILTNWDIVCDVHTESSTTVEEITLESNTDVDKESSEVTTYEETELDVISHHEELQSLVESVSEKYGSIGTQVAVVENGTVADSFACGWATLDEDKMTSDHKMRIASISKVAVGIAAMLLQEDDVVDIDADISDYWGEDISNPIYPNTEITIRSMLTHTSSILCYGDDCQTDYDSLRRRFTDGFSNLVPGDEDSWWYNNYAFRALGVTLELAAGKHVDDILRERLFEEMEIDASFASGDIEATDKLVTLYYEDGSIGRSTEEQLAIHLPSEEGADGTYFAGGLTISSYDLAKIVALLASDGYYNGIRLMSGDSVAEMEICFDEPLSDGSYQAVPLVYWSDIYGRNSIYCHTGSAYGVYNCFSYDPDTGDGIVVLTTGAVGTTDEYSISLVCSEINDYIYHVLQDDLVENAE